MKKTKKVVKKHNTPGEATAAVKDLLKKRRRTIIAKIKKSSCWERVPVEPSGKIEKAKLEQLRTQASRLDYESRSVADDAKLKLYKQKIERIEKQQSRL